MELDLTSKIRQRWRRIKLAYNRFRASYQIRKQGRFFKILIPHIHRNKIKWAKYILAVVGILSGLIALGPMGGLILGVVSFFVTWTIEKVAFGHHILFIHPLPNFELENEKWVGTGFGFIEHPNNYLIPLISMIVNDMDYAEKLHQLFLSWTGGTLRDEKKNIKITIVVLNSKEYIFLCFPNYERPIAKKFFEDAKEELRGKSLEDEVSEHHMSLILGKRCSIGPHSFFEEFRRRYDEGIPVAFNLAPIRSEWKGDLSGETPPFIIFDFSIRDRSSLTRKDPEFGFIWNHEKGGRWQGPPEEQP